MAGQDPMCPLKDMAGAAPCRSSQADCLETTVAVEASAASDAVPAVWVCSQRICRDFKALLLEVERERVAVDSLWRAVAGLQAA